MTENMKKHFLPIIAAALLAPSLGVAQGTTTFSLVPERGTYNKGDEFSVQVVLNAPNAVTSLQASLLYNSSVLSVVSIEERNQQLPYWWKSEAVAGAAAGEVMLQASAPAPGAQGNNIPIATVHFRAKENGLAAVVANSGSLALASNDSNTLHTAVNPAGAIFTIGTLTPTVSPVPVSSFSRNLRRGDQVADVKALQQFLNAQGFQVASSGPGSVGQETEYFGPATEAALIRFQEAYASEILAPWGLRQGTGYFGSSTRQHIHNSY